MMQTKDFFTRNARQLTQRLAWALFTMSCPGCAIATSVTAGFEDAAAQAPAPADEEAPQPQVAQVLPANPSENLWARLRAGFSLAAPNTPWVGNFAHQYAASNLLDTAARRAAPLLYLVVEEVEKRGLPLELALIPFVESAFQPAATSPVGAHGPWQFMPYTGKRFGLAQDRLRDERRAWLASTRAALNYLQTLHTQFDDWHLAIAAYNTGEGAVDAARRTALAAGVAPRFENLRLPRETREYVPRVFALARLIAAQSNALTPIPNAPSLAVVAVAQDMDVKTAAQLAGLTESQFRQFNPAFSGPLIASATTPELLLPMDATPAFEARLATHTGPLASWRLLRLHRAATAVGLAHELGMSLHDLLSVNPLPNGHRCPRWRSKYCPAAFSPMQSAP